VRPIVRRASNARLWRIVPLLASLVVAAPAIGQVTDDRPIVPGQRIGSWTLDMTITDLLRMNGPRKAIGTVWGSWEPVARMKNHDLASEDFWIHRWDDLGLRVSTLGRDSQRVGNLGIFDNGYHTASGIRWGVTRQAVEAAHGKPTAITVPLPGRLQLIYDDLGLSARVSHDRVDWILVFRPRTAAERWVMRGLLGR
jgi:hypothetical protein